MIKDRCGQLITDWREWTRPKELCHWKTGRSAMEQARAWFTSPVPVCPPEIVDLLSTSKLTAGIEFYEGRPEHITGLPKRGEGRNHDMLLRGRAGNKEIIACIEAKVDEKFGNDTIGQYWSKASQIRANSGKTGVPERMQTLLAIVFGEHAWPNHTPWCHLRYQLLTGVAGTLFEAAKANASVGVFIVHEFHTHVAIPEYLEANHLDFVRFVEVLCSASNVEAGRLYGPVIVSPSEHLPSEVALYLGKATYCWGRG